MPAKRQITRENWRTAARNYFPEHSEIIEDPNEEYAIYRLFFQLRLELAEAVAEGDTRAASTILNFAGRCLKGRLESAGENIVTVAGVALFEHLFDHCPQKDWPTLFACLPRTTYLGCRS
jgi:hypothetical protein